jgi:para-aminobenzoate synthetase/4-amino-4-deoxychorismate lyase
VEPHPGLWHLVSDVTARARPESTDADLVRAAFPPGSVTGAPKIQALKAIADLEGTQREVYTGAIGYSSPHAGLELNVAIRTLEIRGAAAWMGCGGGIVADSDPHAELEEALAKARPIAAALGAAVAKAPPAARPALRLRPWVRRPDPALGLIETIAIRGGEPIDVEPHLDRLAASARALYGLKLPRPMIEPTIRDGVVRVLLRPDRRGVTVEEGPARPLTPVILEPRRLAGGLGPHKWLDRPHEPHHLAVDLDGSVLEAGSANVWILDEDGTLVTPPADGRILPGTTRARMLCAPHLRTRVRRLTLDDLAGAAAVLLTSSIRLVTPAALYPREASARAGAEAARLREHPAISRKTGSYIR